MVNKKKTHINILYVPENINYVVTLNSDECVAKNLREFKAEFAIGMKHWLVLPDGPSSFNGSKQIQIINKELSKYYKRNIHYSVSWASRLSHIIVEHWSKITPGHERMTFKWEELVTEFFDISYCANPNKMN